MKPNPKQLDKTQISREELQQLDLLRVHRRVHRKRLPSKPLTAAEHFDAPLPTRRAAAR